MRIQRPSRDLGRLIILLTGMFLFLGVCASPTLAEENKTITINPIGNHPGGEKFNISGTTTLPTCKKIGIEILPKNFWDVASEYAKTGDAGRIIFMEIPSTKENFNPSGIKLVRSNKDGTQSTEVMEKPSDHWTSAIPLAKSRAVERNWTIQIDKNENGTAWSPGSYHVNVWDASTDVQHPGFTMGNGWDIINKKIYPSTARANVWDIKNQKDLESAEFTITKG